VYWYLNTQLESGPVIADLATTVIHSYKSLINDFKPVQSLTRMRRYTKTDYKK